MRNSYLRIVMILLILISSSFLVACSSGARSGKAENAPAVTKEKINGTDLSRLTLTAKAAERLGIQLAAVANNAVPYSAVLYGLNGKTFVYTSPEPLIFVRAPIVVERIEGGRAVLVEGPPSGAAVVTVGAAELYGVEFGVGK